MSSPATPCCCASTLKQILDAVQTILKKIQEEEDFFETEELYPSDDEKTPLSSQTYKKKARFW